MATTEESSTLVSLKLSVRLCRSTYIFVSSTTSPPSSSFITLLCAECSVNISNGKLSKRSSIGISLSRCNAEISSSALISSWKCNILGKMISLNHWAKYNYLSNSTSPNTSTNKWSFATPVSENAGFSLLIHMSWGRMWQASCQYRNVYITNWWNKLLTYT